jgi:glycogen debranching enzyme
MSEPWWVRVALRLRLARIARLFRRDTRYLPAAERASDGDGLRMLALAQQARRYDFELRQMPRHESVLIEDVAFNSLLAVSNRALLEIALELGQPIDDELERSFFATDEAIEELWDEPTGQYYSRDAVSGDLLRIPTIATFLPLWAGAASQARARRLISLLDEPSGFWPGFPVPSVPIDAPQFDDDRYWKGPTWVNTNWAIIEGLRVDGATDVAEQLRERTLTLVEQEGFAEYFSALTGRGFGADEFSWTAALTIDLLAG